VICCPVLYFYTNCTKACKLGCRRLEISPWVTGDPRTRMLDSSYCLSAVRLLVNCFILNDAHFGSAGAGSW